MNVFTKLAFDLFLEPEQARELERADNDLPENVGRENVGRDELAEALRSTSALARASNCVRELKSVDYMRLTMEALVAVRFISREPIDAFVYIALAAACPATDKSHKQVTRAANAAYVALFRDVRLNQGSERWVNSYVDQYYATGKSAEWALLATITTNGAYYLSPSKFLDHILRLNGFVEPEDDSSPKLGEWVEASLRSDGLVRARTTIADAIRDYRSPSLK